jgi:hypothetical protein
VKDPIVVPWFPLVIVVIVWRLIAGWTSWFDLVVFALAVFALAVMQQALTVGSVIGGTTRAFGGTAFLTTGYWSFFEKTESDGDRPGDQDIGVRRSRALWDEWLLLGALVVQVVLELLVFAEAKHVPWFQVLYGLQILAIGVLTVKVVPKVVSRMVSWWRR